MKSKYTAREFDIITDKSFLENECGYCVLQEEHFKEFIEFTTKNTSLTEPIDSEKNEILDFFCIGFQKGLGTVIKVRNFVGLIQLPSGCQVQVLPKISFGNQSEVVNNKKEDVEQKTISVVMKMFASLKNFKGRKYSEANLNTREMSIFDVFIQMYIESVSELVKTGLKSAYNSKKENLNVCKGKILIKEQIKYNYAHAERFYCEYDEYNLNRPENKIIKSTLLKLERISAFPENSKLIKQLLAYFELVEPSANLEKDFSAIHFDRSNADYEEIIEWSKIFLTNKSFTTFSGDSNSIALLFPMEKVYEAYVSKNAKQIFGNNYFVHTQYSSKYLFEDSNKNQHFKLKPDIVMEAKDNDSRIIMDTKWKRLVNDSRKNYGISQGDMYQMFAYSKKYEAEHVWLLYPKSEGFIKDDLIVYNDKTKNNETFVHVFFIDVERITTSLERIKDSIEKQSYLKRLNSTQKQQ